jgi:hypothetical protein
MWNHRVHNDIDTCKKNVCTCNLWFTVCFLYVWITFDFSCHRSGFLYLIKLPNIYLSCTTCLGIDYFVHVICSFACTTTNVVRNFFHLLFSAINYRSSCLNNYNQPQHNDMHVDRHSLLAVYPGKSYIAISMPMARFLLRSIFRRSVYRHVCLLFIYRATCMFFKQSMNPIFIVSWYVCG